MLRSTPSFFRLLVIHNFLFLVGLPVMMVYILVMGNLLEEHRRMFLGACLALVLSSFFIMIINSIKLYQKLVLLLESGHKRTGQIIEKDSRWYRTYIVYEYRYKGQVYRSGEYLPWSPTLKKFKIGQDINIFVNKQSPSHALFYELYA